MDFARSSSIAKATASRCIRCRLRPRHRRAEQFESPLIEYRRNLRRLRRPREFRQVLEEKFNSRRLTDDQDLAGPVANIQQTMWDFSRHKQVRTRPGFHSAAARFEKKLPFDHVERLILPMVHVQRSPAARRRDLLQNGKPSRRLLPTDNLRDRIAEDIPARPGPETRVRARYTRDESIQELA